MRLMIWLALILVLFGASPGGLAYEGDGIWSNESGKTLPKRVLPHHNECPIKLPADFWDAEGAEKFRASEEWAWEQTCLGRWADMRNAPGGEGRRETCKPLDIEESGQMVPDHRKIRSEFLELILSKEPWASATRRPSIFMRCALVDGSINLYQQRISPGFHFLSVSLSLCLSVSLSLSMFR